MSDSLEVALVAVLSLAAAVLLFLLFRFILCWYFKINRRVSLLEEQNRKLGEIIDILRSRNGNI